MAQPWVAWVVAGLLLAGGGWLTVWAVCWDRARDRRRCPKCWYDLRGTPGMRCSECGYEAKRERQLHRTRRRWRLAVLGLLIMLAGGGAGVAPKVRRDGWLSLVPTDVLLRLAPPAYEYQYAWGPTNSFSRQVAGELSRRHWSGQELASRHWKYLVESKGMIRTRARWPANMPLAVSLNLPLYTRAAALEVRAQLPDATTAGFDPFRTLPGPSSTFLPWTDPVARTVGAVAPGTRQVVFDCRVSTRGRRTTDIAPAWQGKARLPITVTNSVDEVLTPVSDPIVTAAVRRALLIRFYRPGAPGQPTYGEYSCFSFVVNLAREREPTLTDIAAGLEVTLLRDGETVGSARWLVGDRLQGHPARGAGVLTLDLSKELCAEVMRTWRAPFGGQPATTSRRSTTGLATADARKRWELRIRGSGEVSLTDWDREKYWAGEFTTPLWATLK